MRKIHILIFPILAFFLFQLNSINAEEINKIPFGIIVGENVNMRDNPDIKGKIIYQFSKGELVIYDGMSEKQSRIGNDNYKWYKIKTQYAWKKKCIGRGWEKVYKDNPTRLEGWVYGKYFKLFEGELSKEDRILKEIIEQRSDAKFDKLTRLYYNPRLQIQTLGQKEYFIYRIQAPDYASDCQKDEYSLVYIMDYVHHKYRELVESPLINTPYEFYDLNNDGYAEIIEFLAEKKINKIISVYSEKIDKTIFRFNFFTELKGKNFDEFFQNSYVELIRNKPDEKMEIIANWVNKQKELIKKVTYKWNGETFVEEKK